MEGELELIRRSDMLVLIPNWEYSKGAIAEMQFAYKNKIPSYRWEDWLEWDDYQKGFAGRRNGTGESVGDAGTEAVPGDTDPLGTLQAVQRVAVGSGRWG